MAEKCPLSLLIFPSCPRRFGGGGGEILNKVYTERLDPEVQAFITLLSGFYLLIFNRKGAPFVYVL